MPSQRFQLTAAEAGQRLDRYLRKLLPQLPLSALHRALRQGAVRIDGAKAAGNLRLLAGMQLELRLPAADLASSNRRPAAAPAMPLPAALQPQILHRDDDLLLLNKPAGLAVMPGSGQTLHVVGWLQASGLGQRSATFAPAPAHRLDRGTSGLLAIGLSPAGLRGLAAAFRGDAVVKRYLAVVTGRLPATAGSIEAALLVQSGIAASLPKVVVAADGQPARTDYEVLQQRGPYSLLRLRLYTGRTHQIRAHLRHLGCAIVGDRRYGGAAGPGDGMLLHAAELQLPHPVREEVLQFRAPLPTSFHRVFPEGLDT